jgi:hypothetical protein
MGCEGCADKVKEQAKQKAYADAKKQAQEEKEAIAICQGEPEGYFCCKATEAITGGQRIVDIVCYVQQAPS